MKTIQRVTLSETTTSNLRQVAARTRLTPNVVARFAMLVSFEHPDAPADDFGKPELVINNSSLFGDIEPFLMTAFTARCKGISDAQRSKLLAAHIARGAAFLNVRVDSIVDLARLCVQ
jgi:DNA sulfur modification protein DndE